MFPSHDQNAVFVVEDHFILKDTQRLIKNDFMSGALGKYDSHKFVVILRDPMNLWANRLKLYNTISSEGKWINKAPTIHNYNDYLNCYIQNQQLGVETVYVNYNFFTKDFEYREKLAGNEELFTQAEDTLKHIDPNGTGSTWDNNIDPKKMKVEQRYLNYKDSSAFRKLYTPEVQKINSEVFNLPVFEELLEGNND